MAEGRIDINPSGTFCLQEQIGIHHPAMERIMNQAFTDIDRLHLLQLLTRRAMAERRSRVEDGEGIGIDIDDHAETEPAAIDEASRWRLLPDGVPLYDWQGGALSASQMVGRCLKAAALKRPCDASPPLRPRLPPMYAPLLMRESVETCGITWAFMLWDLSIGLRAMAVSAPWRPKRPIRYIPLTGDPL